LAGKIHSEDQFEAGDIRLNMPRFKEPNLSKNLALVEQFKQYANQVGCTIGQLALAWCLSKGDDILALPGTRSIAHLEENMGALNVRLNGDLVAALDQNTVAGPRYPPAAQKEIDTEEF
jgi:aryl-alcohol dehydrogenase-like predicted oxidoreductase